MRAATPLGYMPAAPGIGLLFELCPGQLPVGVSLPGASIGHDHQHHGAEDNSQQEPDQCQIGHLLSSTATVDNTSAGESPGGEPASVTIPPALVRRSAHILTQRSRDPPA